MTASSLAETAKAAAILDTPAHRHDRRERRAPFVVWIKCHNNRWIETDASSRAHASSLAQLHLGIGMGGIIAVIRQVMADGSTRYPEFKEAVRT